MIIYIITSITIVRSRSAREPPFANGAAFLLDAVQVILGLLATRESLAAQKVYIAACFNPTHRYLYCLSLFVCLSDCLFTCLSVCSFDRLFACSISMLVVPR